MDLTFHVLLKSKDTLGEDDEQRKTEEYLKLLIERLEKEKGNDFSNIRIQFQVLMSESWDSNGVDVLFPFYKKILWETGYFNLFVLYPSK